MTASLWSLSWRADPTVVPLADRHYNRQKIGAPQFVPPGRCLVLKRPGAFWVTAWPLGQYVQHAWPGAWLCSAFRHERIDGAPLSSDLVRDAVAATRWRWPDVPALGMVTFVDPTQTRRKRDPGRCFRRAGFVPDGHTVGGLVALRLDPADMPDPLEPTGAQLGLFDEVTA